MARLLHTSWQRLGLLCLSLSLLLVPYLFTLVSASSANYVSQSRLGHVTDVLKTHLFTRAANNPPLLAVGGSGNEYVLGDGTHIFDASGGAAVSCIGRYHKRVADAWVKQYQKGIGYLPASLYAQVCSDLATFLVDSTGGKMVHAEFYGSGSDANEAGMKFARQYHAKAKEKPEPSRTLFISRDRSYHGATLGTLDLGGHKARRALYEPMLANKTKHVAPCYPYRHRLDGETNRAYGQRLSEELEDKIIELGSQNVAGFIIEPVVGAALGCVAAVDGYLEEVRKVCDRHGVLLIFDEVMCGMGRTGYLHAWQKWGVAPDIQLIGKGLAGGAAEISGMLVGEKVAKAFARTGDAFAHGHTFRNFPLNCAVALATQEIVRDESLLQNVREKGPILERKLQLRLGHHRYVGDIRGMGSFWAIEFVQDKFAKKPFPRHWNVADRIHSLGLTEAHRIHLYPGTGSADGTNGDHIKIMPAYNISEEDVDTIVDRTTELIERFFDELDVSMD